jgi:hypothetical protein
MSANWISKETTTHQDHVIAHVVGATVLGYFIFDEALHVLLDIGFIWTIFLDGEMGLLPHPVAVSELEMDDESRNQVSADIDALLGGKLNEVKRLVCLNTAGSIQDVEFFAFEERRRLLLSCEDKSIEIETSLETAEIQVNEGV